jgi:hypothetical protein
MRNQAEIEESIRNNLSIVFGKAESVDRVAFLEKYNRMLDYATTVSQPFLSPETIRYQSTLLYASLIFISLSLFHLPNIQIVANAVSVNRRLLVGPGHF